MLQFNITLIKMTKEEIIASLRKKHMNTIITMPETGVNMILSDMYDLLAHKDYKEITGFDTPNELAAYEEGRGHEQKAIFKFIENWNGETNSELGRLLNKKIASKCEAIDNAIAEFERLRSVAPNIRDMVYLDGVLAVLQTAKDGKL